MSFTQGIGNNIDISANISENVVIGNYNFIGKNVVISGFKGQNTKIIIGDCNFIHDNTRILIGEEGLFIGDWNVFHNNILMLGEKHMQIGHNCWFGQNTIIDSSGGLQIGNGVRVGMYSQIWTHVASGELIEGCTLYGTRKTIIEDEVWLVGSCTVASGVVLKYRSTCLINSNITKDTDPLRVYGGNPAKLLEKLSFWKDVTLDEKFLMMEEWVEEFCKINNYKFLINKNEFTIEIKDNQSINKIIIGIDIDFNYFDKEITLFDLKTKRYTKRLSEIERKFYRFIFDHKARFIPAVP